MDLYDKIVEYINKSKTPLRSGDLLKAFSTYRVSDIYAVVRRSTARGDVKFNSEMKLVGNGKIRIFKTNKILDKIYDIFSQQVELKKQVKEIIDNFCNKYNIEYLYERYSHGVRYEFYEIIPDFKYKNFATEANILRLSDTELEKRYGKDFIGELDYICDLIDTGVLDW